LPLLKFEPSYIRLLPHAKSTALLVNTVQVNNLCCENCTKHTDALCERKTGSNYINTEVKGKASPSLDKSLGLQEDEAVRHSRQSAH